MRDESTMSWTRNQAKVNLLARESLESYQENKAIKEKYMLDVYKNGTKLAVNDNPLTQKTLGPTPSISKVICADKSGNAKATLRFGKQVIMEMGVVGKEAFMNFSNFNMQLFSNMKEIVTDFFKSSKPEFEEFAEKKIVDKEAVKKLFSPQFIKEKVQSFEKFVSQNIDELSNGLEKVLIDKLDKNHQGFYFDSKTGYMYQGKEGMKQLLKDNVLSIKDIAKEIMPQKTKHKDRER